MSEKFTFLKVALTTVLLSSAGFADTQEKLEAAFLNEDMAALKEVLSDQTDFSNVMYGNTPILIRAAVESTPEFIQHLVVLGVPVDQQDREGNTALMRAIQFDRFENAWELRRLGADTSIVNVFGQRAKDLAVAKGQRDLAVRLRTSDDKKFEATLALFNAAQLGDEIGVKSALEDGADLLALDNNDRTFFDVVLESRDLAGIDFIVETQRNRAAPILGPETAKSVLESAILSRSSNDASDWIFFPLALNRLLDEDVLGSNDIERALPDDMPEEAIRIVLKDLGVDHNIVEKLFPKSPEPLPSLEYELPLYTPAGGVSSEDWKAVQRLLKEEGLYKLGIDGKPGKGTYDGIYAYIVGLAEILVERASKAKDLSLDNTSNFGISEVKNLAANKSLYLFGERMKSSNSSEALGYYLISSTKDPAKGYSMHYAFDRVRAEIRSGISVVSMRVSNCKNGVSKKIVAPLFGGRFVVEFGEKPKYTHWVGESDGQQRKIFEAALVGDLPKVQCPL